MEEVITIPRDEWTSDEIRKRLILKSSMLSSNIDKQEDEIIIKLKKEIEDLENKINSKGDF